MKAKSLDKKQLLPLSRGIRIEGKKTAPARFEIFCRRTLLLKQSIVQVTIHEGRNHQVKNMLKAVGLPVQN